ncbi:DUF7573 domain-containing protein [Halanaeroarchaeum sulfurireducens]|uniref:DUF7573 domain-containing protein n=1 Tax=Halanaeroarchaeum sulfurireducens TaxID=1604004 RepID=UPI0011874F34|nr:hypothetical protein [Halanaeroarchaeum sulfurireducens]
MTRNASLDAFQSADGAASASTQAIIPTSAWTPEGAQCASCGAVVERRWRQDDTLVCPDCKDWTHR